MAIAIFRVDAQQDWIYNEIREGRLRQGWGAPELCLIDSSGNPVSKENWETTYEQVRGEQPSPRRYSILCRMLQLSAENVDIVVVPKMPNWNQFTIARMKGGYSFDKQGSQLPPDSRGDYRHVIEIDPDSVRTFNYQADDDSFLVSGLFSRACHWAAVSFNHDPEHRQAIERLLKLESREQGQDAGQLFGAIISESIRKSALSLQEQSKSWNGQKFEDFVRRAFKMQNYNIIEDHPRFDGQGADCDILVSPPSSRYDLFLPEQIAVQVKWKQGIDHDDVEGIRQIIKWENLHGKNTMMKCVISSADDFTEEARKLAEENEVSLIYGLQTMCFLLGIADRYREDWRGISD